MNWNIFYAVSIGLLTAIVAGLAGQLAAKETWHKWVFWGGGFITLILIFFQARATEDQNAKNEAKQEQLQTELNAIRKQLSEAKVGLAVIQIQPDPQELSPKKELLVGAAIGVTEGTARSLRCSFDAFTLPGAENSEQNRIAISQFKQQMAKDGESAGEDRLPGTYCYKGLLVKLNEKEIRELIGARVEQANRIVYLMAHAQWKNDSGADFHTDVCKWMEPPKTKVLSAPGWHDCVH